MRTPQQFPYVDGRSQPNLPVFGGNAFFFLPVFGGIACSEVAKVKNINIKEEIDRLRESKTESKSNSSFLLSLSQQIAETVRKSPENFRKAYDSMVTFRDVPKHELAKSMMTILSFTYLSNITWGVGYEK